MAQQRQINIRLEDSHFEALEVAAFIHRRSMPDELRAAVLDHLSTSEGDPRMAQAQQLRDEPQQEGAAGEGVVRSLDTKRRRNRDA
ncbi:MAG TPA: hypothetical protein VIM28_05520 [Solirubrobacterales bacterium]